MKVSKDVAEKEITDWLDYKKVSESRREVQKPNIETLINAVCDGILSIKDDKTFVHELLHPFGDNETIAKIEYKPRVNMATISKHIEGVKQGDVDGRLCAIIAALTNKTKGVIKLMDTEDYSIAQSISVFFL